MILVDLNVLLYAIDEDAPQHDAARGWFEREMSGDEPVGFAWIVLLGFLRLTTRAGILRRPLAPEDSTQYIDEWLAHPGARAVAPTERHWPILRGLLSHSGTAANLTGDAHLAALALEHGASIASFDRDFRRFAGVRLIVPGVR
ncbi:MAG: type II toxin-antitoxin system VapC family toxin [Candidatus Eisenbacteria bacterium]